MRNIVTAWCDRGDMNLLIIGFNMREIYLYRRIHGFIKRGISRKSVSRIFCDDLQTEKVKNILYEESG